MLRVCSCEDFVDAMDCEDFVDAKDFVDAEQWWMLSFCRC